MKCKNNCNNCKHCTIETSKTNNFIFYTFVCSKYNVYGDTKEELLNNVQWEKEHNNIKI